MTGVKISTLPWADAALDTDQLEVNQGGTSRRVTVGQIAELVAGNEADAGDFGAVGDGVTDDTAALQAAFNAAIGKSLLVPPGTYLFTSLSIPAGSTVTAANAVFRSTGTFNNAALPQIGVGANSMIDELHYSTPTGENYACAIQLGAAVRIERIILRADAQMAGGGGVETAGQNVYVGSLDSDLFDRPYHIFNDTGVITSGSYLGHARIRSYIRGIRVTCHRDFRIDSYHMDVRSPNAAALLEDAPGQNGMLFAGAYDGTIGDGIIADSSEHAIRIAGSSYDDVTKFGECKNLQFGVIKVLRPRGCAFKINPAQLDSPGVGETARNISVDGLYLSGNISTGGNREFIRCSHAANVRFGIAMCDLEPGATLSCQHAIQINDTDGFTVGHLHAKGVQGSILVADETSDVSPPGEPALLGPVKNLYISKVTGEPGAGDVFISNMTTQSIGPIIISGIDLSSVPVGQALLRVDAPLSFTGPVHLTGYVGGTKAPTYTGPAVDDVYYDIVYGMNRLVGRPGSLRFTARQEMVIPALDLGDVPPNGLYLAATTATGGVDTYGASLAFSRVGSNRRGAAIAIRQTGANAQDTGPAFFIGATTTGNDGLREAAWFDHNRALWLGGALHTGTPGVNTALTYTVPALVNDMIFAAAGTCTVTLPPVASNTGRLLGFTNRSNQLIISAASDVQPKLGGAATTAILPATAGTWCEMKSDGAKWIILRSGT